MKTMTPPRLAPMCLFLCVILLIQAGCVRSVSPGNHPPVDPSAGRIIERAQPSIHDDPAVRGEFPDRWTAPAPSPAPSAPPGEGAHQLIGQTKFAPLVEVELSPGAVREVELQVAAPSALNASVRWIGTNDALDIRLFFNGTLRATGRNYRFARNRGGSFVRAETTAGGRTVLSVTNPSSVAVRVRILLGAIAL